MLPELRIHPSNPETIQQSRVIALGTQGRNRDDKFVDIIFVQTQQYIRVGAEENLRLLFAGKNIWCVCYVDRSKPQPLPDILQDKYNYLCTLYGIHLLV